MKTLFLALLISTTAVAADLPADLAAIASNQDGGSMFFSTYDGTKDGSLKCPKAWHVILTTAKDGQGLLGCWTFYGTTEVHVHWVDNTDSVLDPKTMIFSDWFIEQLPDYAQGQTPSTAPSPGHIHHNDTDTRL